MTDPRQHTNLLSWDRAVAITAELTHTADAEVVLADREIATGIFAQSRPGETYNFIHQTICEYLAAFCAAQVDPDGWDRLMATQRTLAASPDPAGRTRLMEVIPFAVALLPTARRRAALADVLELADMELYGRCVPQSQVYDPVGWSRYVRQEHAFLTTGETFGGPWLSRLRLVQMFVAYAEEDPIGAVRLAEACHGAFITWLVRRMVNLTAPRLALVRIAAVLEYADMLPSSLSARREAEDFEADAPRPAVTG
ncbi:hypothetical protein Daura_25835 [Dactylosporangium aurantiacum]|uniref:Uncharacterized protein n=1 Tax=Dactylosporangium aurantiacum TaxID=35754 RepID=A0A9Q9I8D4_9ACTN|nr:hypothetical protein [Dactylosporangium aurantiacum]MDG6109656.1 hypothetical protein [Dactylosporangium aurantiacum]UWZ50271.1 hypothetical protein Daura_25835 [Dactylosporangium aurantiacum]